MNAFLLLLAAAFVCLESVHSAPTSTAVSSIASKLLPSSRTANTNSGRRNHALCPKPSRSTRQVKTKCQGETPFKPLPILTRWVDDVEELEDSGFDIEAVETLASNSASMIAKENFRPFYIFDSKIGDKILTTQIGTLYNGVLEVVITDGRLKRYQHLFTDTITNEELKPEFGIATIEHFDELNQENVELSPDPNDVHEFPEFAALLMHIRTKLNGVLSNSTCSISDSGLRVVINVIDRTPESRTLAALVGVYLDHLLGKHKSSVIYWSKMLVEKASVPMAVTREGKTYSTYRIYREKLLAEIVLLGSYGAYVNTEVGQFLPVLPYSDEGTTYMIKMLVMARGIFEHEIPSFALLNSYGGPFEQSLKDQKELRSGYIQLDDE